VPIVMFFPMLLLATVQSNQQLKKRPHTLRRSCTGAHLIEWKGDKVQTPHRGQFKSCGGSLTLSAPAASAKAKLF